MTAPDQDPDRTEPGIDTVAPGVHRLPLPLPLPLPMDGAGRGQSSDQWTVSGSLVMSTRASAKE